MPLRIAIVSTPRTGNTWLRLLLMEMYAIPGLAVHRPDDLKWAGLPEECVLQLHWRRSPDLVQRLQQERFRVLCVTRDPLDVLISILQFCWRDDSTLQWLDGEGGDERGIYGAMPGSAAFLEYAAGPRAAALLAVSREWAAESITVRYEHLVADGLSELKRLADLLKESPRRQIAEVIEGATIPKLQVRTGVPHHFWQGRPGLWRSLLIRAAADRLAEAHRSYCAALGYSCSADPLLSAAQADANWLSLVWPPLTEKLRACKQLDLDLVQARREISRLGELSAAAIQSKEELAKSNEQLARTNEELLRRIKESAEAIEALAKGNEELTKGHYELVKSREELRAHCLFVEKTYQETLVECKKYADALQVERKRLKGLGPTSLAMARWLSCASHRMPVTVVAVKKLLQGKPRKDSSVL